MIGLLISADMNFPDDKVDTWRTRTSIASVARVARRLVLYRREFLPMQPPATSKTSCASQPGD